MDFYLQTKVQLCPAGGGDGLLPEKCMPLLGRGRKTLTLNSTHFEPKSTPSLVKSPKKHTLYSAAGRKHYPLKSFIQIDIISEVQK